MLAFVQAWMRAFLWGDSAVAGIAKIAGMGVAYFGLRAMFDQPVYLAVYGSGLSIWKRLTVGDVIFGAVVIAFALSTAGVAWVRSRGPRLQVYPTLIADGEHEMFRLRVRNRGEGLLEPDATLIWIEDEHGPSNEAVMPLVLQWGHHQPWTRPRLSRNDEALIDVAHLASRGLATERLDFMGEAHTPSIFTRPLQNEPRRVSFCVKVTIPGTRSFAERAWRLEPDQSVPLGYRPIRLKERETSDYFRVFRVWAPRLRAAWAQPPR